MKKHFLVVLFSVTAISAFAQRLDEDWAQPNPDYMTYFQNEMSSLMRFQAKRHEDGKNPNIPFFIGAELRGSSWSGGGGSEDMIDTMIGNAFLGFQIKLNNSFYIPIFGAGAVSSASGTPDGGQINYKGQAIIADHVQESRGGLFAGTGLIFNTTILKGGFFAGYSGSIQNKTYSRPHGSSSDYESDLNIKLCDENRHTFKIALLPLVETTSWYAVGKVLNNILGYAGLGDSVEVYAGEEDATSNYDKFIQMVNYALDFSFNRIDVGPMNINAKAFYQRGNYDAAAKADTYGLAVQLLSSRYPLGFRFALEGGYRHFYSVYKEYVSLYPGTGYVGGNLAYAFRRCTIGLTFDYDNVNGLSYTYLFSTNFFASRLVVGPASTLRGNLNSYKNPENTGGINYGLGARYRHGAWK